MGNKFIHVLFILLEIYIIVSTNLLLRRRVIRCLRKCNSAVFLLFWISFNKLSHYFSSGLQEKMNFRVEILILLISVITSTKFVHFPWLIGNERRPSNSYKWSSTSTKQMKWRRSCSVISGVYEGILEWLVINIVTLYILPFVLHGHQTHEFVLNQSNFPNIQLFPQATYYQFLEVYSEIHRDQLRDDHY